MINKRRLIFLLSIAINCSAIGQTPAFTKQDTLRGSITAERAWWDLTYYHLEVEAIPNDSTLIGKNTIYYKVLESHDLMQIDLQTPMKISRITQNGQELQFTSDGNAHFIKINENQQKGNIYSLTVFYEGTPLVTKRPPWDAVLTWEYYENGNPFFVTSCQGEGASMWWPCKDHMYDEPDSMLMSFTVPKKLIAVGNGRLIKVKKNRRKKNNHLSMVCFESNKQLLCEYECRRLCFIRRKISG